MKSTPRHLLALAMAVLFTTGSSLSSRAQTTVSEASVLSALPVAVSVAAPVMIFSAGAALTVVSVQASAAGTVLVLERASDGARATLRFSGQAASAAALALGTSVAVVAMSTGWLLSAAGQVIAFVPNEIGASLLHNERVTR